MEKELTSVDLMRVVHEVGEAALTNQEKIFELLTQLTDKVKAAEQRETQLRQELNELKTKFDAHLELYHA